MTKASVEFKRKVVCKKEQSERSHSGLLIGTGLGEKVSLNDNSDNKQRDDDNQNIGG